MASNNWRVKFADEGHRKRGRFGFSLFGKRLVFEECDSPCLTPNYGNFTVQTKHGRLFEVFDEGMQIAFSRYAPSGRFRRFVGTSDVELLKSARDGAAEYLMATVPHILCDPMMVADESYRIHTTRMSEITKFDIADKIGGYVRIGFGFEFDAVSESWAFFGVSLFSLFYFNEIANF